MAKDTTEKKPKAPPRTIEERIAELQAVQERRDAKAAEKKQKAYGSLVEKFDKQLAALVATGEQIATYDVDEYVLPRGFVHLDDVSFHVGTDVSVSDV